MGKINILSLEICNRIAAGEVIERPYSAVKEMVENSIDAGATEIEIYIERGGKDLIKIVDNGCGIEKDDMRAAFFAHATSKITNLEDIDHIHTLGFRGEALATIASVSCVELISCVEGQEANKVVCDGEFIGKVEPAVAPKGTQITVRKFFFNTPVRFKFMKSDKKEETDITFYVVRYILGNPDISFKYYIDGKLALQSYGGGLEEAITQVYGAKVLPNCFKISAERNDIKISGFISNQNYFKSNKSYQTTFLNGRYINNPTISSAITNAYSAYAMKKQFPFYVLFIEMSDEIVDVNVHPNKLDVRFVDNSLIYGTVYKVISTILDGTVKAADFVIADDENALENNTVQVQPPHSYANEYAVKEKIYDKDFNDVEGIEKYKVSQKAAPKPTVTEGIDLTPYENYEAPDLSYKPKKDVKLYDYSVRPKGAEGSDTLSLCCGNRLGLFEQNAVDEERAKQKTRQEQLEYLEYKYRGSLFNTYLLYEEKDDVYIIDQHAAHERLIYDELKKKLGVQRLVKQSMLVPYIFIVNNEEQEFIEKNMDAIWQMGFSVEPFGGTAYRVNEIPADLPDLNLKEFFEELLSDLSELKTITLVDALKEKIAQTACKHAIKGGKILTNQERDKLFAMLRGNMGLKCPHGRPVCVKLKKSEIEKMFKRKV